MSKDQFFVGSGHSQKIFHHSKDPPLFFVMMRFNVKIALCFLVFMVIISTIILYSICGQGENAKYAAKEGFECPGAEEIDCNINGEYIIGCRKEGDEVFLPFSFLHKYFEIYGKIAKYGGLERFEWSHSYSRVHHPKTKYDPKGVFMYFENYNVEVRDRVKCVSAIEGVPVSTQWESQGYFYPTQIAQFGLSHYSKNLTEPDPRVKIIENGDSTRADWAVSNSGAKFNRIFYKSVNSHVLEFKTDELVYMESVQLKMDHVLDFVMSLNLKLLTNGSSLSVKLQNRETKQTFNLHYVPTDVLITAQESNIYHGLGGFGQFKRITRDLIIDLQKGLNTIYLDKEDKSKHKIPRSKLKIIEISLRGEGALDNFTLATSQHINQFYDAAEWFVRNQDPETGGWAIPVRRKLASGFRDLQPGWYSSMGQGHAISLLSRAHFHSGGDLRYLNAAVNGLKPFRVSSLDGGVLATFMGKYHWYEEYPTRPASFVLNGFIYSLLGLYDLMTIAPVDQAQEAEFLFNEGMESLKGMLMLYDMGSVTAYDLRHVTLGVAPNLARWDYHATHINQLLLLSKIQDEAIFSQTAERWIGYMSGKRAAHN